LRRLLKASLACVALLALSVLGGVGQEPPGPPSGANPLERFVLSEPAAEFRLSGRLREISGLAVSEDGRVFAHDDERAVIYEIDTRNGDLVKAFAMGDAPIRGDFEGIAVVDDRFYLVSSDGVIYESGEGGDDDRMLFNAYATGVGRRCEVEGLAHEPVDDTLLILCKNARDESLEAFVAVFRWSRAERSLFVQPLLIDLEDVERATDQKNFAASGIERDPRTGHYVLIAGPDRAVVAVRRDGRVLGGGRLDADRHPQAEGITFGAEGRLWIADEGASRRARLTAYAPIPDAEPGGGRAQNMKPARR
jgi:uncharacterized protein YjiK